MLKAITDHDKGGPVVGVAETVMGKLTCLGRSQPQGGAVADGPEGGDRIASGQSAIKL